MPYEFLAKNGLISQGNITATGSLTVTQNITASNISASSTIIATSFTGSLLGTSSWATNALTASSLVATNSYTITNLTASGVVKASQIAEKVVTFTPLTGSITGAPAWYRIISGSGVLDSGRVRMSANYDNSRSDIEFTYAVRNYDTDGAGAFINITRASTYNSVFNAVRVIEGTLNDPYAIDVLIGNYLNNTTPDTVTCLYESQFIGAVLDTPTFVSASATGSNSNVVKTVYTTYASGYPRIGPVYSDGLSVATYQGQLTVGYRGNYNYGSPSTNNYALLVSGSVGIGTTSPSEKLTVSGSSYIIGGTGAVGTGTAYYLGDSSNKDISLTRVGAATLAIGRYFPSAWVETIRFTADGNVGIGTTSPRSGLQVNTVNGAAANEYAGLIVSSNLSSSRGVNIAYDATNDAGIITAVHAGTGWKPLALQPVNGNVGIGTTNPTARLHVSSSTGGVFEVDTAGGATTLYVSASGNVGIGTTNPTSKLQIIAGNSPGLSILSNNTGQYAYQYLGRTASELELGVVGGANQFFTGTVAGDAVIKQNSTGKIHLGYGSAAPSITIDSSNNVGIGTTSVTNELHIYKLTGPTLNLQAGSSGTDGFKIIKGDSGEAYVYNQGAYGLSIGTNNTQRIYITSTGNIGIGTTNPAYLLDVSGSSRHGYRMVDTHQFTGSVSISGSLNATASWATNALTASYLVPTNSYTITNLTASNISASGTGSFGIVGIGTVNPSYKLHIVGNVYGTTTGQFGNAVITGTGTGYAVYGSNAGATGVKINLDSDITRNDLVISASTGYVGIGTTSPTARLHVSGSTGGVFEVDTVGGATTLYVSASGNVGIGTIIPIAKLQVAGAGIFASELLNSSSDQIGWVNAKFTDYNDGHGIYISSLQAGGGKWLSGEGRYWNSGFWRSTSTTSTAISLDSGALKFYTNTGLTANSDFQPSERMRINSAGNVGIGTTTPSVKLAVEGGSIATVNITGSDVKYSFDIRSLVGGAIGFNNAAASNVYGAVTGSAYFGVAQSYPIVFTTAGTERMRIEAGGNVGIGTTNPVAKLQVAGNISGSSFTSSISNAVGFLGTSSWATNAVTASFVPNAFVQGGNSFGTTALLGTNDAQPLSLETNGTIRMSINSNGNVAINASTSGNYRLNISDTHRGSLGSSSLYIETAQNQNQGLATSANDSGITNVYTVNNFTSSAAIQSQASFNQMIIAGSGSFSGSYRAERNGILFSNTASLDSSANIVNTFLTNQISSNIPTFSIPNWVAGTQTYVDLITGNSTGSITNLYNHQISSPFLSGGSGGITVNNSYGIYIAKQKTTNIVTNGWGIYQADTGDLNIFAGKTRIGSTTTPVNTLDVSGNISGSSFTSSISNAVGFLGTASWANNVVSASYATTAQTANALNTSNNYQVNSIGVGIAGSGTAGRIGMNEVGIRSWSITPTGGRLVIEAGDGLGSAIFSCPLTSSNFVGPGTGLTGTAASLTAGTANALNTGNSYTVASLTSGYVDVTGTTIPTTGIYRPSTKTLGLSADGTLIFKISNVSAPATSSIETGNFLVQSGNVGIGTTNATDKLTVYGALASYKTGADTIQTQVYLANGGNTRAFNIQLNSGGTGLDLWSYNSSNAWLRHTTFNYDGNVGIGTAAPAAKLEISGSSNSTLMNIKSPISGAILYVSGSGAVGIGTSNVGAYTLQVNGSFAATTKSFVIDHPTKEGKKLIYGSLESPYHGIRLTGRDTLVNGKCKIQLPDYMYKLILHDSVNIQLTGIKCNKTLYVDEINIPENYFTIAYDKAIFESYKDYDFFWDFTAIRADVPELNTEL